MNTKVEYAIRCMQWKPTSSVLHVTENITIEENNDMDGRNKLWIWCLLQMPVVSITQIHISIKRSVKTIHIWEYFTLQIYGKKFTVTNLQLYSNRLTVTANLWFFNAFYFHLSLSGRKNEHKIIENKCVWYGPYYLHASF